MKKAVGLLCLLLAPLGLLAQINESDTLRWQANAAITGFWQDGNVQTFIFRATSDMSVKPTQNWVFKTTNSYVYQAFGGFKADEDILSLNFLSHKPQQKVYPVLLAFFSTNFRRDIDLRTLYGAGATIQLISKSTHWLKLALSSEYEQTFFGSTQFNRGRYNGQDYIDTFRATLWLNGRYELFDKKLVLSHQSYVQPSIQQRDNYRWQADFGIELPVSKHLNFKINYLQTFESVVINSQQPEDRFLTFGLSVKSF